jgi:glycosyltransferase involved in cell wall biosynthesis
MVNVKKLIIVTRNMKAGGAERVISQLTNRFSEIGIQCTIVTIENEEVFYHIKSAVKVHAIGKKSNNSYIDKILKYREVRRYVKNKKPDIVLALPEEIGIFVIPALLNTNIPVVVSERSNPWVMPWKKATRLMRKLFYPLASGFIFQTEQAASFFSPKIRKKSVILPNPLDLSLIPKPWEGERRKEIIGAGRLVKEKNLPLLINAFAKFYDSHQDYVLIIYGEGSLKAELMSLAESVLPQNAYCFPGRVPDLLERMRGAAMFVLSSDFEGMPNVVIEAMAMGIPVISTNCPSGGPAELIEDGKNGLLVPVGDTISLCMAMHKIAKSKELAYELSKNALEIKNRLDSIVVAEKWREYLDAISKKK